MTSNKSNKTAFWERQKGESSRSFEAFRIYRDQGPTRSLRRTCEDFYGGSTANLRQIEEWSRNNLWTARAEAYDAHLDELRRKEREQHVVEHLERARRTGLLIHALGVQALRQYEGSAEPPLQVAKVAALGLDIERRALGLPDQFVLESRGGADPGVQALRRATELLR